VSRGGKPLQLSALISTKSPVPVAHVVRDSLQLNLCEYFWNDISVDVSQAVIATLMAVGQLFVIDAQQMQNSGVEIVNVHRILDDVV
jgi:hypothetical protein